MSCREPYARESKVGSGVSGGLVLDQWGQNDDQCNFFIEFPKQHIDCAQHLHMQSKQGGEA